MSADSTIILEPTFKVVKCCCSKLKSVLIDNNEHAGIYMTKNREGDKQIAVRINGMGSYWPAEFCPF